MCDSRCNTFLYHARYGGFKMNQFKLEYKIEEQGIWKTYDTYATIEDAIEASGEILYDGFIVRIVEGD